MVKPTHAQYMAFQRALVRRIASASGVDRLRSDLRTYYLEYLRDVDDYQRIATKEEILRRVTASRIVLGGDYHSLDQSKKTHLRILRRLARRERPVCLALECLPSERQDDVDAFMRGDLPEAELLRRIDYRRRWGFAFGPYRELLDLARSHGFTVLALNGPSGPTGRRLKSRDRHMARLIVAAASDGRLVYAIVGDWHLAHNHLPARVRAARPDAPPLLIYQNSDSIYWKLASRGLEQATDAVLVRPGAYCIVNATPFVKLASYALWEGHRAQASRLAHEGLLAGSQGTPVWMEDASDGDDAPEPESDTSDTFSLFVEAIARFFDLHVAPDVTILTPHEGNLMQRLVRDLRSRDEDFMHETAALMVNGRSFYVPQIRTVYLGTLSLNAMADMASRFIYHALSRSGRYPADARRSFYARVMREAVTFLGALIINHKRPYRRRADYEELLREARGRRQLGPDLEQALVARHYLRHRRIEKRVLAGGRPPTARAAIYHLKPIIRYGVTRGLGQALGRKLHEAMVRGLLPKADVAALYREDWCRRVDPLERYIGLVRETRRIEAAVRERDGRL